MPLINFTEQELQNLRELMNWYRRISKKRGVSLPPLEVPQEQDLILAWTPSAGIPKANSTTFRIYGRECELFKTTKVSATERAIEAMRKPDGNAQTEVCFHLDPETDCQGNTFVMTMLSRWGVRFVIWESCGTWPSGYGY